MFTMNSSGLCVQHYMQTIKRANKAKIFSLKYFWKKQNKSKMTKKVLLYKLFKKPFGLKHMLVTSNVNVSTGRKDKLETSGNLGN